MKPNDITRTLDNYLEWKKPDYAVLLTGGWGTGKTFFIKEYRKRFCWAWVKRPIYVSLYGIKEESEIENQIFVKVLFSNALKSLIALLMISFVGTLIAYSVRLLFVYDKDNLTQWIGIAGISLLPILAWIYKTFKTPILSILLSGSSLIFDDFERSEIPIESRFAYINRYVEHLHKHVIIICNDKEIKDTISKTDNDVHSKSDTNGNKQDSETAQNTTVFSSFQKIQEKVIGKKIIFEQPPSNVLRTLLKNSDLPCLKEIVFNKKLGFDWFISVSTPQNAVATTDLMKNDFCPVNYRVWSRCCRDFEFTFNRIIKNRLTNVIMTKSLIEQFFPLIYASQIHDFGNKRIFPLAVSIDHLISQIYRQDSSLKWFRELFPSFNLDSSLSKDIWNSILFGHYDVWPKIEQYWTTTLDKKESFINTIFNFYVKTDEAINNAWKDLYHAFHEGSITNLEVIVELYISILDMISKHCCPDDNMNSSKVFRLAKTYCKNLCFDIQYEYQFEASFLYYCYKDRLNSEDLKLFQQFLNFLRNEVHEHCHNRLPDQRFQHLLVVLKAQDNATFYKEWANNNFDSENIFTNQDPFALLQAILHLPISCFGERMFRAIKNLRESRFNSTPPYVKFKRNLVLQIQNILDSKDNNLQRVQKYYLSHAVEMLTSNLIENEKNSSQANNSSPSTDKEPEQ